MNMSGFLSSSSMESPIFGRENECVCVCVCVCVVCVWYLEGLEFLLGEDVALAVELTACGHHLHSHCASAELSHVGTCAVDEHTVVERHIARRHLGCVRHIAPPILQLRNGPEDLGVEECV